MPESLPSLTKSERDEVRQVFEHAAPNDWTRTVLRLLAEVERLDAAGERLCKAARTIHSKSTEAEWAELRKATAFMEATADART